MLITNFDARYEINIHPQYKKAVNINVTYNCNVIINTNDKNNKRKLFQSATLASLIIGIINIIRNCFIQLRKD